MWKALNKNIGIYSKSKHTLSFFLKPEKLMNWASDPYLTDSTELSI